MLNGPLSDGQAQAVRRWDWPVSPVLSGVRAMVARVYGGEEWHVNDDGYVGERSAGMKGRGHVYTLLDL